MSKFPTFDFKIDCGDDPRVRQWLHDNGRDFPLGGIKERHLEQKCLAIKADNVYISHEGSTIQIIDPFDYMHPEPTVAERMAAFIEKRTERGQIPGWARWIAVDKDGDCCVYSVKPFICNDVFTTRCVGRCDRIAVLVSGAPLVINWRETLTELPTVKRELIVQDDPVAHATAVYDQQKMIDRDERDQSQAELDYSVKRDAQGCIEFCNKTKTLAIPSICLAEPTSHMRMLGGEFGGKHDSR